MSVEQMQTMVDTPEDNDTQPTLEERRERIRRFDRAIIDIALARSAESRAIGAERMASGGVRTVHGREIEVIEEYRGALGPDGIPIAISLLALGRGRPGQILSSE